MSYADLNVGVLAIQGDYELHSRQIFVLGANPVEVRLPKHLEGLHGLIIPGGETTTMNIMIDRFKLREPMLEFGRSKPIYGTCAGMIMLAKNIENNQSGVRPLGLLDIDVIRNDYGRQIYSFDEEVTAQLNGVPATFSASFIRAPRVSRLGTNVRVLAEFKEDPVLVQENRVLASSFHAEVQKDTTLLEYFFSHFLLDREQS